MDSKLSPLRLKRAQTKFQTYNVLNSVSFLFLNGSIITLYALKIGASSTYIGFLSALSFMTFFFLPLGKRLVRHFSIVKVFGGAWLLRYIGMAPIIVTPFLYYSGRPELALAVILASTGVFNLLRGIGLIGNNPLIHSLGGENDRGKFLVSVQIMTSVVNIFGSLVIAFALGDDADPARYSVFMAGGVVSGIIGSFFLLACPEPDGYTPETPSRLLKSALDAFREETFRTFVGAFFLVSFVAGVARTFITVYSKQVYAQADSLVMIYTVAGFLGALAMGMLSKLLVTRVGAKPLYIIYTAIAGLSLVPMLITPSFSASIGTIVFLSVLHFITNFGFAGEESAGQTYFFNLIKPETALDLGVVYFMVYGTAGAAGSLLGGFAIEILEASGFGLAMTYRIAFASLLAMLAGALVLQSRLARLGASSIAESLGVIFSLRDLRAITVLDRLDRVRTSAEEMELIQEMSGSDSHAVLRELVQKLASPRLWVRVEALHALERAPSLSAAAEDALLQEVDRNAFTTAYIAARVLGKAGVRRAIPLLKETMQASDYMLSGESMLALARLGARDAIPEINRVLYSSENPRLLIFAASALETLKSRDSISAIIDFLKRETPPLFVRDELVLAIATIMGMEETFYPEYMAFIDDEDLGIANLRDRAETISARKPEAGGAAINAIVSMFTADYDGSACSRILLRIPESVQTKEDIMFSEAALDPSLTRFSRFRFFLSAYAIERSILLDEDAETSLREPGDDDDGTEGEDD